jgi:integrase
MTPRRRKSRIYWNHGRLWGDFRDFADVGGKREPLIPKGDAQATTDPDLAAALASGRLTGLRALRRRRQESGAVLAPSLAAFARDHLIAKKKAGKVTYQWLAATEGFFRRAIAFFGADRALDTIRPRDVRAYVEHLGSLDLRPPRPNPPQRANRSSANGAAGPDRPRRTMTPYSIRAHLFALSNLYRRAQESEVVLLGYNPVAVLMDKPAIVRREAHWLEVHEAALYLEAAHRLPPLGGTRLDAEAVARLRGEWEAGNRSKRALAGAYGVSDVVVSRILRGQNARDPLDDAALAYSVVATFLLTGGRYREVLGLELDDVSFDRKTVTFRPNRWRRLKTQTSWRVVPLWPQLEEILRVWVFGPRLELGGSLLFPSFASGQEGMLQETRRLLDRVALRAGWKRGEIRHRLFRHTYCAARLQTLDRGAPVSLYTVSRELGHGSEEMVRRVYSHLGSVRHRAEVVEYRVEQHYERLGEALRRLGFVIKIVIKPDQAAENEHPREPLTAHGDQAWSEWARRDSNPRPLAPEASALSN